MLRTAVIIVVYVLSTLEMAGLTPIAIVADSVTRMPLSGASVFDSKGSVIGVCDIHGRMPYAARNSYPLTIRYLGFKEKSVEAACTDTIFLHESFTELPEVLVETKKHKVMHMLAYVREYSTLSTYTDTVYLFREKMVDYMLTPDKKVRFKGWSKPRVLKSKSYYRFTNAHGLDSVSDECNHHFSWSDWISLAPVTEIASGVKSVEQGTDTLRGKYSPAEMWTRNNSRITVDVNVLADSTKRKWVPNLAVFFRNRLDFENFRIRFNYDNITGDFLTPFDLTGYSFNIDSNGRGHTMFMFNRINEPFFVSTYAEVYMLDKEYISVKEARKWEQRKFNTDDIEIYEPAEAPALQPSVLELITRVNHIDTDRIRLAFAPDPRLVGRNVVKQGFGQRVLQLLKMATGISSIKAQRKWKNNWKNFKQERIRHNNTPQD